MNRYEIGDVLKVTDNYIVNPLTGDTYGQDLEFQIVGYVISKDWEQNTFVDYDLSLINNVPYIELQLTEDNVKECFEYVRWEPPIACEEWLNRNKGE